MSKQMTFGEKLRALRNAKGLTQRDLAGNVAKRLKDEDRRGFDFTYLSKIENNRTPPPPVAAIVQLALVLEADTDELIALAGKVPPEFGKTLKENPAARAFYRSALNANLTDEDWKKLLQELQRRTEARENPSKPGD
jgi:transcriptional regulator with XRE-family HTH domain